jgi:hypothetical protein
MVFWKLLFKLSCVCLLVEKLVNRKHFLVNGKLGLVSRKVFSIYFGRKTLSRICKKLKSILLFVNYIKFGPQSFDSYIFCFKSLFYYFFLQFHLLEFDLIWFLYQFGPHSFDCYFFSLILFLIDIFYLSNLVHILFIIIYFIWNNL